MLGKRALDESSSDQLSKHVKFNGLDGGQIMADDMLFHMMNFLDGKSILDLSLVSKQWNEVSRMVPMSIDLTWPCLCKLRNNSDIRRNFTQLNWSRGLYDFVQYVDLQEMASNVLDLPTMKNLQIMHGCTNAIMQNVKLDRLTELQCRGYGNLDFLKCWKPSMLGQLRTLCSGLECSSYSFFKVDQPTLSEDMCKFIVENIPNLTKLNVPLDGEGAMIIAQSPQMKHLTSLYCQSSEVLEEIAKSEHFTLKHVGVEGCDDKLFQVLSHPFFSSVERFTFDECKVEQPALLKTISSNPLFRFCGKITTSTANEIKSLLSSQYFNITDWDMGNLHYVEPLVYFGEAPNLLKLKKLSWCCFDGGDKVCEVLALCTHLKNLESLKIDGGITEDGILSLCNSHFTLNTLTLDRCSFGIRECKHLASIFSNLTSLALNDIPLRDERMKILFHNPNVSNLTVLHFRSNLKTNSMKVLSSSPHLAKLTELKVTNQFTGSITQKGVYHIITSPFITKLRTLSIVGQQITDEVVEYFTKGSSPILKSLTSLDLSQNFLSRTGCHALLSTNNLPNLCHLDLVFQRSK